MKKHDLVILAFIIVCWSTIDVKAQKLSLAVGVGTDIYSSLTNNNAPDVSISSYLTPTIYSHYSWRVNEKHNIWLSHGVGLTQQSQVSYSKGSNDEFQYKDINRAYIDFNPVSLHLKRKKISYGMSVKLPVLISATYKSGNKQGSISRFNVITYYGEESRSTQNNMIWLEPNLGYNLNDSWSINGMLQFSVDHITTLRFASASLCYFFDLKK